MGGLETIFQGKKVIHVGDSYQSRASSNNSINSTWSFGSHSKQSSLSPRSSFSVGGSIEEDGRDPCEEVEEEGAAQYRVCLLGSARVGKSTILEKFFSPQSGDSERWLAVMLEGTESHLVFTELQSEDMDPDTAGENECIVVVFSLTDSSSLEDTKIILDK